jgi:4-hydroxybenzoate polyprenyltransferase
LVALIGFFACAWLFDLGRIYLAGAVLVAVIIILEQILVAIKEANIPMAFFTLNGIVSILFLCILILDRWLEV